MFNNSVFCLNSPAVISISSAGYAFLLFLIDAVRSSSCTILNAAVGQTLTQAGPFSDCRSIILYIWELVKRFRYILLTPNLGIPRILFLAAALVLYITTCFVKYFFLFVCQIFYPFIICHI